MSSLHNGMSIDRTAWYFLVPAFDSADTLEMLSDEATSDRISYAPKQDPQA